MEDLSRSILREQFETNLFGLLELTNLIIPVMRQQNHGRIISVSSMLGLLAIPYTISEISFRLSGILQDKLKS